MQFDWRYKGVAVDRIMSRNKETPRPATNDAQQLIHPPSALKKPLPSLKTGDINEVLADGTRGDQYPTPVSRRSNLFQLRGATVPSFFSPPNDDAPKEQTKPKPISKLRKLAKKVIERRVFSLPIKKRPQSTKGEDGNCKRVKHEGTFKSSPAGTDTESSSKLSFLSRQPHPEHPPTIVVTQNFWDKTPDEPMLKKDRCTPKKPHSRETHPGSRDANSPLYPASWNLPTTGLNLWSPSPEELASGAPVDADGYDEYKLETCAATLDGLRGVLLSPNPSTRTDNLVILSASKEDWKGFEKEENDENVPPTQSCDDSQKMFGGPPAAGRKAEASSTLRSHGSQTPNMMRVKPSQTPLNCTSSQNINKRKKSSRNQFQPRDYDELIDDVVGPNSKQMMLIERMICYMYQSRTFERKKNVLEKVRWVVEFCRLQHEFRIPNFEHLPGAIFERWVDIIGPKEVLNVFKACKDCPYLRQRANNLDKENPSCGFYLAKSEDEILLQCPYGVVTKQDERGSTAIGPPNILSIAVAYGYQLAKTMSQDESQTSDILNTSTAPTFTDDALQSYQVRGFPADMAGSFRRGAETLWKMAEHERLMFWSFESESPEDRA